MEELQDAIEDAQYVSAIASAEDGPRPVLPWEIPSEEQLATWKESVLAKGDANSPVPFQFEWVVSRALGLFLFSAYLKEVCDDYVEINFIEEVLRWKATRGRLRADVTSIIVSKYLTHVPMPVMVEEEVNATSNGNSGEGASDDDAKNEAKAGTPTRPERPAKTEITETDLAMQPITRFTPERIREMRAQCYDASTDRSAVGLCGPVLDVIVNRVDHLRNMPGFGNIHHVDLADSIKSEDGRSSVERDESKDDKKAGRKQLSIISNALSDDLFDEALVVIAENLKEKHWEGFQLSEQYTKLLNFLWFQDRRVVEEDFFLMRVLGRGGFGLVTGESASNHSLIHNHRYVI